MAHARVRKEHGRRRTKHGFASRDLAQRVLAKIVQDVQLRGAGLPPDPRTAPTLAEAAGPWLERRKQTHRAAVDDANRWRRHVDPLLGHLRPSEVDAARLRAFAEAKLDAGLAPASVRLCVMLLSALFCDLVERGLATSNPVRSLPKSTRRMYRPDHDPRTTPFVEKTEDVRRIFLHLAEPVNVAYAIGAFAGLRTGEVLALRWDHVDLTRRAIHVRESIRGPLKDKDSRIVPVIDSLLPILTAWKLKTGGVGRVLPPMRSDGEGLDEHTLWRYLRSAQDRLHLPRITWYQATRHTFASHWVSDGGALEALREIMGHCSVLVTERYAHRRPDMFRAADYARIGVDLRPGASEPTSISCRLAEQSGENAGNA